MLRLRPYPSLAWTWACESSDSLLWVGRWRLRESPRVSCSILILALWVKGSSGRSVILEVRELSFPCFWGG